MGFTPCEITIIAALAFTFVLEHALMDQEDGFDWFVPSYFINNGCPPVLAWTIVILIAIVSPIMALLKIIRWVFISFLKERF